MSKRATCGTHCGHVITPEWAQQAPGSQATAFLCRAWVCCRCGWAQADYLGNFDPEDVKRHGPHVTFAAPPKGPQLIVAPSLDGLARRIPVGSA